MEWAVFALLAGLLWSVVVIIDKYVSSKEVNDFIVASVAAGFLTATALIIIPLFKGAPFQVTPHVVFIGIVAGMIYRFASTFYYAALKYGEASQVDPLVNTQPFFVMIISFFLFGERFGSITYIGIILVMLGAISLALNESEDAVTKKRKFKFSNVLFIALFAAIIYAVRSVMVKFATMQTDIWSLLFWVGVGIGLTSWILTIFHHPRLTKDNIKGIRHLGFGIVLNVTALILYTQAIALGPVTLVSTMLLSELFFVFLIATFLSFIFPNILTEKIARRDLWKKGLSILVLVIGLILIL